MVEYVKKWWRMGSTACKIIFSLLGLFLLSALSLSFLRGRKQASESHQDSSRKQGKLEVAREEGTVAVHHTEAAQALAKAEVAESQAGAIDVRVQAAKQRIAALKKELGR